MNPNQKQTNQTKKPLVTGQTSFIFACIGAATPILGLVQISIPALLLGFIMGIVALNLDVAGRPKAKWAVIISTGAVVFWLLVAFIISGML